MQLYRLMQELSARPGLIETVLAQLDEGKNLPALLTPRLVDTMLRMTLGKD